MEAGVSASPVKAPEPMAERSLLFSNSQASQARCADRRCQIYTGVAVAIELKGRSAHSGWANCELARHVGLRAQPMSYLTDVR